MTKRMVSLPDSVAAKLTQKLAAHGYTLEQFAASSLSSFAESGAPVSPEIEKKLLEALESPLLNAQDIDWAAKATRLGEASGRQSP